MLVYEKVVSLLTAFKLDSERKLDKISLCLAAKRWNPCNARSSHRKQEASREIA
jgi:hypothetical protein